MRTTIHIKSKKMLSVNRPPNQASAAAARRRINPLPPRIRCQEKGRRPPPAARRRTLPGVPLLSPLDRTALPRVRRPLGGGGGRNAAGVVNGGRGGGRRREAVTAVNYRRERLGYRLTPVCVACRCSLSRASNGNAL